MTEFEAGTGSLHLGTLDSESMGGGLVDRAPDDARPDERWGRPIAPSPRVWESIERQLRRENIIR